MKKMMESWKQLLLIVTFIQGTVSFFTNATPILRNNKTFLVSNCTGILCGKLRELPTVVSLYFKNASIGATIFFMQAPGFSCPAPEGFYTMNGACDSEYYLCMEGTAYYQVKSLNARLVG